MLEADQGRCCSDRTMDGLVAELHGELEVAAEVYAQIADSTDGRSVMALAEVELARARMARARNQDDRPHLQSAARWPGRKRDRIEALLGEPCGDSTEPRTLTPREHEVAALVARGITNGGIADELFISTKTASVHVSNILSKLSMASRTEIAAWVASGGLESAT